ncbi:hypothetical protein HRI_001648000 [Hibiscus trionum]|uniref:RNase H type-1 domain-containing protein n=1 Tax=Hibiscus trionum TaxID=183268 RepID=A0A9W7LW00_HIBTR|nr:hypothetical protein HRI_001648000 [Hibiscus trionum]
MDESVNHLFCHCKTVWRIWQIWANLWNVFITFPSSFKALACTWYTQPVVRKSKPIWNTAFVWTIWCCRNGIIFNKSRVSEMQVFEAAVQRIHHWIKSKWPKSTLQIHDLLLHPTSVSLESNRANRQLVPSWTAPPAGALKFIVDASTRGSFGESGIGGIIRNHTGQTIAIFSKAIGLSDPTGAEISALTEACRILIAMKWHLAAPIIIESDCESVIKWIENILHCPAVFKDRLMACVQVQSSFNWRFSFMYRDSNCVAHRLAVKGISRSSNLLWIVNNFNYHQQGRDRGMVLRVY